MQPQGHAQMVLRVVDYEQNPQAAADAPRWQVMEGTRVALERGISTEALNDLAERGHEITQSTIGEDFAFGGAQLIYRTEAGYVAGTDPRKEGQAIGY